MCGRAACSCLVKTKTRDVHLDQGTDVINYRHWLIEKLLFFLNFSTRLKLIYFVFFYTRGCMSETLHIFSTYITSEKTILSRK